MTREEMTELVDGIYQAMDEPTLFAMRLANALGISRKRPRPLVAPGVAHRRRGGRFKGARKLMAQRYGVRL